MSRIKSTFESLRNNNKKALIPFFTAGDPHPDKTVEIMHALVESGADMIELGIPFSDPMADGPIIQRASERALKNSVGITAVIKLAADFRKKDKNTPLILMGYANPIEAIGIDNFISLAEEAGIDGVITVDYPPEESEQFVKKLKEKNIDSIFLLSPTTDDKRIDLIIKQATGFLYYVSLKGVTGSENIDINQVAKKVTNIKKYTSLPIAVGFGVRDAKTAKEVSLISDAVVIGSRIVKEIENSNNEELINNIKKLMDEMKMSIEKNEANGNIFNVGSGVPTTVKEVAKSLKRLYNSDISILISGKYRKGDIRHNYADLTKVKDILGFIPKYSFQKGILEFVKWVKTQDIMEDKYKRSIIELKQNGFIK